MSLRLSGIRARVARWWADSSHPVCQVAASHRLWRHSGRIRSSDVAVAESVRRALLQPLRSQRRLLRREHRMTFSVGTGRSIKAKRFFLLPCRQETWPGCDRVGSGCGGEQQDLTFLRESIQLLPAVRRRVLRQEIERQAEQRVLYVNWEPRRVGVAAGRPAAHPFGTSEAGGRCCAHFGKNDRILRNTGERFVTRRTILWEERRGIPIEAAWCPDRGERTHPEYRWCSWEATGSGGMPVWAQLRSEAGGRRRGG